MEGEKRCRICEILWDTPYIQDGNCRCGAMRPKPGPLGRLCPICWKSQGVIYLDSRHGGWLCPRCNYFELEG